MEETKVLRGRENSLWLCRREGPPRVCSEVAFGLAHCPGRGPYLAWDPLEGNAWWGW